MVNKSKKKQKKINKTKKGGSKTSISVVIPCHNTHFKYLNECIQNILQSTLLPNEIIVSLNNVQIIGDCKVDNIEKKYNKNGLKILRNYTSLPASENRHNGSIQSKNDIIIYTDADDLIHPQKIEIINHFFKKYPDTLHINHEYSNKFNVNSFNINKIKFANYNKVSKICQNIENYTNLDWYNLPNRQVHAGHLSIKKKVLKHVKWDILMKTVGEDSKFCREICNKFNKSIIILEPLSFYRRKYSSLNY